MPDITYEPPSQIVTEEPRDTKPTIILLVESAGVSTGDSTSKKAPSQKAIMQRNDVVKAAVQNHNGQLIKAMGTSILAEFSDPAPAVRAAVELGRLLAESNQRLSENDQANVQMGIHGTVVPCEQIELFAGAVNVAASIAKNASSGQILTSRDIYEALAKESDLRFQYFGNVTITGQKESRDVFEVQGVAVRKGIPSRYEALFQVGAGGMGIVYKGRDLETGDFVALKVLRSEIAADATMQENLRREVSLARKVTHKNVCRIYEFNRSSEMGYISMEFVDGESLLSILRRGGALSWTEAAKIMRQVCAGLAEAHAQGIVHRDLKPGNIMIDRNGVAKIMDFGIAHGFQASGQMTAALVGTPAYMAPEQVELKGVDSRTDVYALGLLLYEMITGRQAFAGDTPFSVAFKQLREFPQRPREIVPGLPAYAETIILKCIQKEPGARFQTMRELAIALNSKPPVSLWGSFVQDLRRSGRELHKDLGPRIEAVERFCLQQATWACSGNRHMKKVKAIGLVAMCFCGLAFFSLRITQKHAARGTPPVEDPTVPIGRIPDPAPQTVTTSTGSPSLLEVDPPPENHPSVDASAGSTYEPVSGTALPFQNPESSPVRPDKTRSSKIAPKKIATQSAPQNPAPLSALPIPNQLAETLPQTDIPSSASSMKSSALNENENGSDTATASLPVTPPTEAGTTAAEEKTTKDDRTTTDRYLEVGSFKESDWADRAVEKLAEIGFHAVLVHKNLLWMQSYQVRVGPYPDEQGLEVARQALISQGFKPHVVK